MKQLKHEVQELKKAFVELAHAVGPMIPENSELHKQVTRWGNELILTPSPNVAKAMLKCKPTRELKEETKGGQ